MTYKIIALQNTSSYDEKEPTIKIQIHSETWDAAYKNWIFGNNPTNSSEWENNVFAITEWNSSCSDSK